MKTADNFFVELRDLFSRSSRTRISWGLHRSISTLFINYFIVNNTRNCLKHRMSLFHSHRGSVRKNLVFHILSVARLSWELFSPFFGLFLYRISHNFFIIIFANHYKNVVLSPNNSDFQCDNAISTFGECWRFKIT